MDLNLIEELDFTKNQLVKRERMYSVSAYPIIEYQVTSKIKVVLEYNIGIETRTFGNEQTELKGKFICFEVHEAFVRDVFVNGVKVGDVEAFRKSFNESGFDNIGKNLSSIPEDIEDKAIVKALRSDKILGKIYKNLKFISEIPKEEFKRFTEKIK